jgi:hypothetical protein
MQVLLMGVIYELQPLNAFTWHKYVPSFMEIDTGVQEI